MQIPDSLKFSNKHIQIDKSYAKMVAAIAGAAFVVIFSLVFSNALIKQISYQNKVIGLRETASEQLKQNIQAINPLVASYEAFDSAPESVIGTPDKNSKIVLDALPSKYDFPALATSLEYLVQRTGMSIKGITGTDNEASAEQNSADPAPIEIPFTLQAGGDYEKSKVLVTSMEKSIRPFVISNLTLSGSDGSLTVSVTGKTYYQPEKKLEIKQTTVSNNTTTVKKTTTGSNN
jgi:Tfp pilus assembly protein PilO